METDVFFGSEVLVEGGFLENDTDFISDETALGGNVETSDSGGATSFGKKGSKNGNNGGFAGAVGTKERKKLTGVDGKTDTVDRGSVRSSIGFNEVLNFYGCFHEEDIILSIGRDVQGGG